MSRRALIGSSAAVLVALVAGVFLGLSLRHKSKPAFVVSSQWVHHTDGKIDLRVLSGTMAGASKWPVVVIEYGGRWGSDFVDFDNQRATGPLRIVEASVDTGGHLTALLRSEGGYTYALDGSFATEMGKRLNPAALPAVPRKGVAVPVSYGADDAHRAVVLVAESPKFFWYVVGFLDGFNVSDDWSKTNERPLVDRGRVYYRIDASARRLERVKRVVTRKKWSTIYYGFSTKPSACEPWPGAHGAYLGCRGKIRFQANDGAHTTIYRDRKCGWNCGFQPVIPSPDERTLLVENVYLGPSGCTPFTVEFLPKGARKLVEIDPGYDFNHIWALGWLDSRNALIGADGPGGECFPPPSGIWIVDPHYPTHHELVLKTTSTDATIWRSN